MQKHVYALRSWTIKVQDEQFFIASTTQPRQKKWKGPYANLKRATNAIARKLEGEFVRRHGRAVR